MVFIENWIIIVVLNESKNPTNLSHMEKEILFTVEKSPNGGYTAKSESYAISASGTTLEELKLNAWDAVICKYEGQSMPNVAFSGN